MTAKVVLYSAVDDEITRFEVDVEGAALTRRETVKVPSFVQYAWPHPTKRWLYVTTSNRGKGLPADHNHMSAWTIHPDTGALSPHGEPATLVQRATHMCVHPSGEYTLNAHNVPNPRVSVHRLDADGTIGDLVEQPIGLDAGIYPHQVRVAPSGRTAVVVDRGNAAHGGKPEDPGALRTFDFDAGVLTVRHVVAPEGGYGFGPRHIDFHTSQPWMYVADEKRSRIYMFRMPGDALEAQPAYTCDSLADRANEKPRQLGGTIHVHPNGRTVYMANRADYKVDHQGRKVFGGGENSIAVFSIDPSTGEPKPIQREDTRSYHVRTFALDPSGKLMVTASILPMEVRDSAGIVTVAAALSVFRVRDDGTLEYVRKYDIDTGGGKTQYWMGIVALN
jgi:6-phosphogluconolactonase